MGERIQVSGTGPRMEAKNWTSILRAYYCPRHCRHKNSILTLLGVSFQWRIRH